MPDELKNMIQRTERYWYIDGLSEIGAGLMITLMAGWILAAGSFPDGSPYVWLLAIGQPLLILAAWWLVSRGVKALKERLTYPRTGYVSYPRRGKSKRIVAALTAAPLAALIAVFSSFPAAANFTPLLVGIAMGTALFFIGWQMNLLRFMAQAPLLVITGALITWAQVPDPLNMAGMIGAAGLIWMVSGAAVLIHYLRSTAPAAEDEL